MADASASSGAKPVRVFVSYARADRARLIPLIPILEAQGHQVWWDQRIDGGKVYAEEIGRALADADVVVVAWSKASIASHWVRDEAERAREQNRLAPLLLDAVTPPLGFRQVQAIDFTAWRGRAHAPEITQLAHTIAALAGRAAPAEAATPRTVTRRWPVVAGVSGAAVAALGAGGLALWGRRGATPAGRGDSVAVVPFTNLSNDPQQAFFSDGLSDEIRSRLAQNPLLQVMGEISSKKFVQDNVDELKLARSLAVAYVLSGSVRKSVSQLRIGTELTDSRSGFTVWSTTFDRQLDDIFAVQSDIASHVSDALTSHLAKPAARPPAAAKPPTADTRNVEAYEAYLRGRSLERLDQGEPTTRAALAEFDKAIALDSRYAAAIAARARILSALAFSYAAPAELSGLYAAASQAAERAAALRPDLADAQSTLGNILFYGRLDGAAAEAPFARAYALGRSDGPTLSRFAGFSAKMGRFAPAQEAMDSALRLDPLNPLIHRSAGLVLCAARRFDDALAPLRRSLALNSKISASNAQIGLALMALGRLDESRAAMTAEPAAPFRLSGLAIVEHRRGDAAASAAAADALVKGFGDGALYQQVQVCAQTGARDAALSLIERGRAASDAGLTSMGVDFLLDPIRAEPRFVRVAKQIGLTGAN